MVHPASHGEIFDLPTIFDLSLDTIFDLPVDRNRSRR